MHTSFKLLFAGLLWSIFGFLFTFQVCLQVPFRHQAMFSVAVLALVFSGYAILVGIRLAQVRHLARLNKEVERLRDQVTAGCAEFHLVWLPYTVERELLGTLSDQVQAVSVESIDSILHHGSSSDSYEQEAARLEQEVADGMRRLQQMTNLTRAARQHQIRWAEEQLLAARSCAFLAAQLPQGSQNPEVLVLRDWCTQVHQDLPGMSALVRTLVSNPKAGLEDWKPAMGYFGKVDFCISGATRHVRSLDE